MKGRVVRRTRAQLLADRVLAIAAGAVLVLVLVTAFSALGSDRTDCAPRDYVHGAWLNRAGDQVAVAPQEDDVLHYVGACR